MENSNSTRVAWLELAWEKLQAQFLPKAPATAAVTVGFSPKTPRKAKGSCWSGWSEGEGYFVSISPLIFPDAPHVLEVLLHEMVHAMLENKGGHGKKFAKECDKLGFVGPPTANTAGPDLKHRLEILAAELGPIPSGKGEFEIKASKKQTTRNRKYVCPCGQIIRAAKDGLKVKHLDCGEEFVQDEPPVEDSPTKDAAA